MKITTEHIYTVCGGRRIYEMDESKLNANSNSELTKKCRHSAIEVAAQELRKARHHGASLSFICN